LAVAAFYFLMSANLGLVPDPPEKIQVKYRWKRPRNFSENEKARLNLH
jgi:hypothetical protein